MQTNPRGGSPRKAPPDTILLAELAEGLNYVEIGQRHSVDPTSIRRHALRLGWSRKSRRILRSAGLAESQAKIVLRRHGLLPGSNRDIGEFLISLPRIPTLHGHFAAAMPSAQGV